MKKNYKRPPGKPIMVGYTGENKFWKKLRKKSKKNILNYIIKFFFNIFNKKTRR